MSTPTDSADTRGLAALYQERILDHYRRPRHKHDLERATARHTVKNPLCGDEITVAVHMDGAVVTEAAFVGTGCSITQASASMLMGLAAGRTHDDLLQLQAQFDAMLAGAVPDAALGELEALMGVAAFPQRHRCARLPWTALMGALAAV